MCSFFLLDMRACVSPRLLSVLAQRCLEELVVGGDVSLARGFAVDFGIKVAIRVLEPESHKRDEEVDVPTLLLMEVRGLDDWDQELCTMGSARVLYVVSYHKTILISKSQRNMDMLTTQ